MLVGFLANTTNPTITFEISVVRVPIPHTLPRVHASIEWVLLLAVHLNGSESWTVHCLEYVDWDLDAASTGLT